jgi:hypothetical protein
MSIQINRRVETTFDLTEKEIKELLAIAITNKLGIDVKPGNINFNVRDGDPGGYGSYGDPKHVYNSPTSASFSGATIRIVEHK